MKTSTLNDLKQSYFIYLLKKEYTFPGRE